jgi:hypothetical protein
MQFLVYLTVLMVSVSTVLLEVHWLTSPPPQPKAVVRTAAPVPVPKADGPNAQLSPVYPTKVDPPQNEQSTSVQQPPASNNDASNNNTRQAMQGTGTETTGVASRNEGKESASSTVRPPPSQPNNSVPNKSVANSAPAAPHTNQPANEEQPNPTRAASNKCDVQACASAYKSFRSEDCTYQPFEGPRQFCAKPPVQRTARDQREDRDRRGWTRNAEPRDGDRRARWRNYDDDDDRVTDMDDDDDGDFIIRRIRRW